MISIPAAVGIGLFCLAAGALIGAMLFAAYDFADQQSRDEEPESAWRGSQGGGVHAVENGR